MGFRYNAVLGLLTRSQRSTKKALKKKSKRAKTAPKPKKVKPFRFLDLSAELRNEIYELALTEPDGLTLIAKASENRRSIQRGAIAVSTDKDYYGKAQRRPSWRWRQNRDTRTTSIEYNAQRSLVPNLLATCKQIRSEGSSYLYKQEIILADMHALHLFAASIGTHNRQLLTELTIRGWTEGTNCAYLLGDTSQLT